MLSLSPPEVTMHRLPALLAALLLGPATALADDLAVDITLSSPESRRQNRSPSGGRPES